MAYIGAAVPAEWPAAKVIKSLTILALTFSCSACQEPFIVFAGGALSGDTSETPTSWSELDAEDVVQLEARPDDPYSINLWAVAVGPDLYIATGEGGTRWSDFIEADRDVRLRVIDKIFELEAVAVRAQDEKTAVAMAYVDKYDLDADDNWVLTGKVYRLDRR